MDATFQEGGEQGIDTLMALYPAQTLKIRRDQNQLEVGICGWAGMVRTLIFEF
jgi:hypothetical protein